MGDRERVRSAEPGVGEPGAPPAFEWSGQPQRGPSAAGTTGTVGRRDRRGGGADMNFTRDVAPGVHRVEDAFTNWYLVEADDGITVVDAGVPTSWGSLHDALGQLGRTTDDLRALVLTHAHFDHVGFAERARTQLMLPVYAHEHEVPLTRHPWRYD